MYAPSAERIWIPESGAIARMRKIVMNGKIIQLEYISPRCECGRDLPKGRKKKCFYCLPPSGNHHKQTDALDPPAASVSPEYTLADRAAQADAYGMSYGNFMAHIENGWPLPKRKKPVCWPLDSAHRGEEQ